MNVYWYCCAAGCGQYGVNDRGAAKHTKDTDHATITTLDRDRWLRVTGQEQEVAPSAETDGVLHGLSIDEREELTLAFFDGDHDCAHNMFPAYAVVERIIAARVAAVERAMGLASTLVIGDDAPEARYWQQGADSVVRAVRAALAGPSELRYSPARIGDSGGP